jgi:hypothetical protein
MSIALDLDNPQDVQSPQQTKSRSRSLSLFSKENEEEMISKTIQQIQIAVRFSVANSETMRQIGDLQKYPCVSVQFEPKLSCN